MLPAAYLTVFDCQLAAGDSCLTAANIVLTGANETITFNESQFTSCIVCERSAEPAMQLEPTMLGG
jgi:hypothetical protein